MPRTRLPIHVASALALLLALGATGCTSTATADPAPTIAATTPAALTPSPTPSPTPQYVLATEPARPAAMDTVDVAGAIATVTYFMELYPYVYGTWDLTALHELSHPECIYCRSISDNVTARQQRGEHQEGPATRVLSATGTEIDPGAFFAVDAQVETGQARLLDAAGNVLQVDDAITIDSMTFSIAYEEGRWLVREAQINDE